MQFNKYTHIHTYIHRTRRHLGRQGVGSACGHPTAPLARPGALVHAHRTEGVTRSERQEGSNGVGSGIGVGGGNGDGNGDVDCERGSARLERGRERGRGPGRGWRRVQ